MTSASEGHWGVDLSSLVEFNHLYVTLDRETVDAIRKSEYVAERFSIYSSTIEADEESWTGVFLLGQRAYLEIFAPGGAEGLVEGHSGTAFSTQRLGQIDEMENRLNSSAPQRAKRNLRVRKTDEGEVPWFHYLNLKTDDAAGFAAWAIDIHKEYFHWRGIDIPSNGRFSRGEYLKASGVSKSTLADDIVELELELTYKEKADLDLFLRTLEFGSTESTNKTKYESGSFDLVVSVLSEPKYRIRRVICSSVETEQEPRELSFGSDARLASKGESLVWEFGPES